MNDKLTQIENRYVESVDALLSRLPTGSQFYAAFVPFFGWDAEPSDHAEHGCSIYLLSTDYLSIAKSKNDNPADLGTNAYYWGEFCDIEPTRIPDSELQDQLLDWYTHQNENDETVGEETLLSQIGETLSNACNKLNRLQRDPMKFTDDFVVFTDCMAGEKCEFGFKTSVPSEWFESKRAVGMFEGW